MTLLEDVAECNKARWELARILLGKNVTGDIVEKHKECIKVAKRLVKVEYALRLEVHDWYYMMSDDPGVYKKGHAERQRLEKQAYQSDDLKKLYAKAKKRAGAKAGSELPD